MRNSFAARFSDAGPRSVRMLLHRRQIVPATLLGAALLNAAAVGAEDAQQPVAARIASVAVKRVAAVRELAGTVRARNSATVAARILAPIQEVAVRAGETVTAGQLLARLDDRASAAEYQRADADRRRYEALLSKQAVTRSEYDAVIERHRVAEAALSHTRVTAPSDGVVAKRFVDAGDMAEPGKPLFVVEQTGAWRFETEIPERLGAAVAEGDSIRVRIDADGQNCSGTVAELLPTADPVTRGFAVKIDLACPQPPRSGAFGRAMLEVDARDAIVVPAQALRVRGQLTYVFLDDDHHARMRLVRTGDSRSAADDAVEILAGLTPGDRVVVSADGELIEGRPLTTSERP